MNTLGSRAARAALASALVVLTFVLPGPRPVSAATPVCHGLPATLVQGNLVVAALYENTTFVSKGIGALDTTAPSFANRSYVGFTGTIDPTDLSTFPPGQFGTMESFGTTGNFRIEAHGRTVDESAVALSVGSDPSQQSVALSWAGSQLTFDVERASRPDFADGQVLATGVPGTVFDDPVLADGHTWYYRIR